MSIIIRLQHLPWSADAADVREFFRGLIIPEGGVHIVGGRDGDVFVQFSSDEDARLAMKNDGKRLKDSKIKLLLSSQKEMQKVIEKARSDYAAGLLTPNFDSRASDDEEENDKKRASGRRSRSRSGSKERSHHVVVQRNAANANSSATPVVHQPTNFHAPGSGTGVVHQFAPPSLQYQASLQPQPSPMTIYSRQMGILPGQVPMPLVQSPTNMQQFAMAASAYLAPPKYLAAGDQDARVALGAPMPPPFFNMFQPQPANLRLPTDHATQMTTATLQAPPSGVLVQSSGMQAPPSGMQALPAVSQAPPTFASVKSPEKSQQQDRRDRGSLLPMPAPAKSGSNIAESTPPQQQPQHQPKILPPPLLTNAQALPVMADLTQMPLVKPPILPLNLGQQSAFNNNASSFLNMQNHFALGHLQNMLIDQQHQQQQQEQQHQKPVIDRSMLREGVFMDNVIAAGRQDGSKNSFNQQIYEPESCICAENAPKDMLRYGTIREFFAPLRLEGPDSIKLIDLGGPFGSVYCRFLTRQEAQLALRLDGKKQGVRIRLCSDVEFDNVRDTTKAASAVDNQFNPSSNFDPRIWHDDRLAGDQHIVLKNGPSSSSSYPPPDQRPQQQQLYQKPPLLHQQDKIVEISNIPYKTYDQAIWRLIEETRPKRLHRKLRLKDGKWLAFDVVFVEYYTIEDAEACFKFNGYKLDGRSLNVSWTSSRVLDDSTTRTYSGPAPPPTFNSRPSPDYTLGTAASRDEKFQQRRRSRSRSPASGRDRSRRRDRSRDRDRERSYEKDRDRDRRNRDRKRTRQSSKERRSSSRDKRRHPSRSPPGAVESSKASSSQTLSDVPASPMTALANVEKSEKEKKERREPIDNVTNIQPNQPKAETKPAVINEVPEKVLKPAVDNGNSSSMTCIFMSGLGPNVSVADILNFFKSFKPVPTCVRLNLEPRGTAYVEFDSASGCEQAFRCKNRHYIGVQMVTLRMCSKSEMTESVQRQHNLTPAANGSSTATNETKNLPAAIPSKQHIDFNAAVKTPAQGTRASGIGLLGSGPPNLARKEPPLVQHSHSNGNLATTHNAAAPPLSATPLPPSIGGGQDVVPAAVASIDPAVVQALGPPGAVCFLHNLPPRITLEEICALFPFDARLIEDSVRMHYSHQTGEPTGDCLLAFQASQDADKACRSINGRSMSGRYLQMWIVPNSGK